MSNGNLNTFPKNRIEALTMLYLEKQNLSDLTPEQLVDKYKDVYNQIKQRFKENNPAKTFSF